MSDYEDIVGPSRPDPEISRRIRGHLGATSFQGNTETNTSLLETKTLENNSRGANSSNFLELKSVKKELKILGDVSDRMSREQLIQKMERLEKKGYSVPKVYARWDENQLRIYLMGRKNTAVEYLGDLTHVA